MSDYRPIFVARKNPGLGWVVDILWSDGEMEVIKGFTTEKQAAEWVDKHAAVVRDRIQPSTMARSPLM